MYFRENMHINSIHFQSIKFIFANTKNVIIYRIFDFDYKIV